MQYEVLSEADVARLVRAVVNPTQSGDGGLDDDDFRISIAGRRRKPRCFTGPANGADPWVQHRLHTS
ncbi:hypothetical protein [Comamonas sp. JC664]|uniref:hypothetical protein n=1 Tax=Comamonas sp. JC664 TaxID=2801917 RepID=UPI00361B19C1